MNRTFHKLKATDSSSTPFIQNDSVSLVVTSPPYPMIEMWDSLFAKRNIKVQQALQEFDGLSAFRLMHNDLDSIWKEVGRVLKPGGFACINIGDATRKIGDQFKLYSNHTRIIDAFITMGFDILPLILWRKQTNAPNKFMGSGMLPAGAYVTLEHEYILIMRKGAKREFKSIEDKLIRQQSAFFWEERNRWFSDIWDFKGARQKIDLPDQRDRSAAYPFELPYRLINMYSVRGDTIYDPFLGTGTTVFAAMASERNSIGIDIEEKFVSNVKKEGLSIKNYLNSPIFSRIRDHYAFVELCNSSGKILKYVNKAHNFPVMTAQEVNLYLECIDNIVESGEGELNVLYREIGNRAKTECYEDGEQLTLAI